MKQNKKLYKLCLTLAIISALSFVPLLLPRISSSSDPWRGLLEALIAMTVTGICIIILLVTLYISWMHRALQAPATSTSRHKKIAMSIAAAVIPVPLLIFAMMQASQRLGLLAIAIITIAGALCAAIYNLFRK